MFPAALVTLVTFVLDLTNSSPVYNMQPAFITTNIGSTNGRNIRNLPCISRKNVGLSGVCMFAIDCLKANGTHLGTCIDRFYFGSCCHIEPIKEIESSIETNIILDTREPPERIHNTTSATSTTSSTMSSLNVSSSSTLQHVNNLSQQSSTTTTEKYLNKTQMVTIEPPSSTTATSTKPFGDKIVTSTTETITTAQKLQTFQILETTTRPNFPIRTTTARPRPALTTTPKPSKPLNAAPSKPISSKPTQKPPSKPVKLTSTTKRPYITTTSKVVTSTKRTSTTKRVTRPTTFKSTVKPVTTTSAPITTTEPPTTRPPAVLTKKPPSTTTSAPTTTQRPTVSTTIKPSSPFISTSTVASTSSASTGITVAHPSTNEIIGSSGLLTLESGNSPSTTSPKPVGSSTIAGSSSVATLTTTTSILTTNTQSTSPTSNGSSSTSTVKPSPGLITWTVEDQKNHTAASPINETVVTGNITEEWRPVTTPDGWVLLPSVTPATARDNESISSTSASSPEPLTTAIPLIDITAPPTASPTETSDTNISSTSAPILLENATTTEEATTTPTETGTQVNLTSSTASSVSSAPVETTGATTEAGESKPVNMSDFTDVCGRRMWPEARIVGGEKSAFGRWPWQISLRQWRTSTYLHKCGAALLNENWAITAAHCVDNVPPSDLLLRLGEHDLSTEGEPYLHEERRVQIVASHPQFDPRTFEYDLALLRFYEPVQFQPNIIPVCVPKSDENFVGRTAYVTGWGRLYEDGPLPSVLQEVSVPVINNSVCESMYKSAGYIEHIPHIFICAGWRKGGFDSCEGDSGGPMVIQREDKRFLLAGVISWGIGCAEPNQPGVYTRISEFRDWINQILQF